MIDTPVVDFLAMRAVLHTLLGIYSCRAYRFPRACSIWTASLVDRLVIFVVPLLVIVIPLIKLAGPLYRWRIRSRIYTWYRHLQETERMLAEGRIEDLAKERRRLDEMTEELAAIDVPLSYADELYELKEHVEYVRSRLETGTGG